MALQSHFFSSAPVGRAVCGSVLCGKYSSTLRKVRFGTAHGALALSAFSGFAVRPEKLFFSFRQFFFPWRADFFSSVGRVGGLSFCPRRFPFRRKSSAAGALFPGVFEFSYKKQSGFFRRLKNMFYSSFLGCLEKFSYLYRTFPPEKSCRKIWWEP